VVKQLFLWIACNREIGAYIKLKALIHGLNFPVQLERKQFNRLSGQLCNNKENKTVTMKDLLKSDFEWLISPECIDMQSELNRLNESKRYNFQLNVKQLQRELNLYKIKMLIGGKAIKNNFLSTQA
jgi:hypothetical protein